MVSCNISDFILQGVVEDLGEEVVGLLSMQETI